MTHEDQSTRLEELLQLLSENGFDGMAEAIETLMSEAMKLERADALGAMPYRAEERQAANGQLLLPLIELSWLDMILVAQVRDRDLIHEVTLHDRDLLRPIEVTSLLPARLNLLAMLSILTQLARNSRSD
jgi:hypothetical protein